MNKTCVGSLKGKPISVCSKADITTCSRKVYRCRRVEPIIHTQTNIKCLKKPLLVRRDVLVHDTQTVKGKWHVIILCVWANGWETCLLMVQSTGNKSVLFLIIIEISSFSNTGLFIVLYTVMQLFVLSGLRLSFGQNLILSYEITSHAQLHRKRNLKTWIWGITGSNNISHLCKEL